MLSRLMKPSARSRYRSVVLLLDGTWYFANITYVLVMLLVALDFDNQGGFIRSHCGAFSMGLLGGAMFCGWISLSVLPATCKPSSL